MNGNCTCGVELVEGARFCHKCGRPVDGFEPMAEVEAPVVAEPIPVAPPPLPVASVGLRSRDSIQAAVLSVAITFVPGTFAAQFSAVLFLAVLVLNGLLGMLLFLRRANRSVTTIEGARQGWISGLFFFGITFIMMVISLVSEKAQFMELLRKQAKAQGPMAPEIEKVMDDPTFLFGLMLILSVMLFVLFTSLASIGGMLGARLFGTRNPNASQETGSKLG